MASLVPTTFPIPQEGAIATYNFTDLDEGLGYVIYNGFNTGTSGANVYILSKNVNYSNDVETYQAGKVWTFNTSAFNTPKVIKGTAILSFSVDIFTNEATTATFDAELFYVRGGVETSLGSVDGEIFSIGVPPNTQPHHYTLEIEISKTIIKKGDNLRLKITNSSGGGSGFAPYLAHSPANRVGVKVTPVATYPTKLEVLIPFELNI